MFDKAEYIAAEPEEFVSADNAAERVYRDQNGGFHMDRADAIDANFRDDLSIACVGIFEDNEKKYQAIPALVIGDFIRDFVQQNPSMTRVLLGERDAT